MTHYDPASLINEIKAASLADLKDGDYGPSVAAAAKRLVEAFEAVSAGQIITACHHDYRLSDEMRKAAEWLDIAIEIHVDEAGNRAYEEAAFQRGWDDAGDRLALERERG